MMLRMCTVLSAFWMSFLPVSLPMQPTELSLDSSHNSGYTACSRFCNALQTSNTFAVSAHYSAFLGDELGLLSLNTYHVAFQRPNHFSVRGGPCLSQERIVGGRRQVTFHGSSITVSVSDGVNTMSADLTHRKYLYASAKFDKDIREAAPLIAIGGLSIFSKTILNGFGVDPEFMHDTADLVSYSRIDLSDPNRPWKDVLYFDADTGELRRRSRFMLLRAGEPGVDREGYHEEVRVDYSEWQFNPKFAPGEFTTSAPAGFTLFGSVRRAQPPMAH